jgi:phosphoribosylformylglycinamidine synthase
VNKVEKALIHGLFIHLHHNIDKAIDFGIFKQLNEKVSGTWPGLLLVGPDANDDAGVIKLPGEDTCSQTV